MKRWITIAAIQTNAEACRTETDFYKKIKRLTYIAKQSGARIVVFPEGLSMWLSWCKESPRVQSVYIHEPPNWVSSFGVRSWFERFSDFVFRHVRLGFMGEWLSQRKYYNIIKRTFSKIAKELNVVIVAGSLYTRTSHGLENISMVFEKDGTLVGEPGKKHLLEIEKSWGVKSSKLIEPVITSEASIGVCICYDLNKPDVVQDLRAKGAEVICAPSGGWRPYPGYPFDMVQDMPQLQRAKENDIPIVRPYQCGWMEPGIYFDGRTSIVNRHGNIVETSQNVKREEIVLSLIEIGHD